MSSKSNSKYLKDLKLSNKTYKIFDLNEVAKDLNINLSSMPYSIRVLFENCIRNGSNQSILEGFRNWSQNASQLEVDFYPARVLMQDFTGVPAVVDLAAMRDAMKLMGGDSKMINPLIPVDLVIDHSVMVDHYGSADSYIKNTDLEFERNRERYEFLKWGQKAFNNFKVVPPGTGICHQVNLEYLAKVVWTSNSGDLLAYPDSLVGTDSHTTMINGLGVLGWGVGGIEAEAAMLGQPLPMPLPEVVGFKLKGKIGEAITATDVVLTVTQILRKKGVVGKFVEFFGEGLSSLPLADRATIANMAPEYGATCGFFPVDEHTVDYLKLSARGDDDIELVENYCKYQKLWADNSDQIIYTDVLELDLSEVEPSLAGPKRPQDRVSLRYLRDSFQKETQSKDSSNPSRVKVGDYNLGDGDVVIAAITSCTNTSNPSVMIAAGLVAKKASSLGLKTKPWVKTSLAPGSKVVTEYLEKTALDIELSKLGFNVVGYGCTTCIGNSGPLKSEIENAISENNLIVSSVLSGNRNFEGRVHPLTRCNYLASPPLVVAFALAGTVDIDLTNDPIGQSSNGDDVYLSDIWPSNEEINNEIKKSVSSKMFAEKYSNVFDGDSNWQNIQVPLDDNYQWDEKSTYIQNPPYFDDIKINKNEISEIKNARIIAVFGDSITTDHISPAGNIAKNSPAAKYLLENKVESHQFNSYGSRRGNHEVMMRGTFANIRIRNRICSEIEGGYTKLFPDAEIMSIYDAAMKYRENNTNLVIFAGKEYGTGSSRDWAAKGTKLLGIKAVIAESFERIHRSNLVGMGVLPLKLLDDITTESLNLKGDEIVNILYPNSNLETNSVLKVEIIPQNSTQIKKIRVQLLAVTESELEYLKQGSILHKVVRDLK